MAKTIDLTIKFKVSELKKMIDFAGMRVVDKDAFEKVIQTAKFKKALVEDILNIYDETNCEDMDAVANSVYCMFSTEVVAHTEFDDCFE